MNKRVALALLAAIALTAVVGGFILANWKEMPQIQFTVDEEVFKCKEDRDCIKASNGCCGCAASGTSIAINKNYLELWGNKTLEECREMGCAVVISNHWTCSESAIPVCINGKCTLSR